MSSIPMSNIEYRGLDSTERGADPGVASNGLNVPLSTTGVNVPLYSNTAAFPLLGTEQWKRQVYDLHHFCYPSDFCFSNWCSCGFLTVAHLSEKTNAFKRWLGIRGVVAAFLIITMILYNIRQNNVERVNLTETDVDGDGKIDFISGSVTPEGMFPYWLFFSVTLIVWKLRYTVRRQRGIAGSDTADCCLSFFCSQCVIMQMAYQVNTPFLRIT